MEDLDLSSNGSGPSTSLLAQTRSVDTNMTVAINEGLAVFEPYSDEPVADEDWVKKCEESRN